MHQHEAIIEQFSMLLPLAPHSHRVARSQGDEVWHFIEVQRSHTKDVLLFTSTILSVSLIAITFMSNATTLLWQQLLSLVVFTAAECFWHFDIAG